MTEKLYYKDAYIKDFEATVISVTEDDGRLLVELDRTAFFPEEGGQSADTGVIGGIRVYDVRERDGRIYHYTESAPTVGLSLGCSIDFDVRFEKMRYHTAEHIVCGIIHSLYGYDNVGFHLGADDVTLDINAVMDRESLDKVETLANRVVAENVRVTTAFPTAEELSSLTYRAKLDMTEGVRLVNIGDYDSCACCAPHVGYTGEIGAIKLLDFEKHRGGTRIHMQAGEGALLDYREKYCSVKKISELLSAPQNEVAAAVEKLLADHEQLKYRLKQQSLKYVIAEAERLSYTDDNIVCLFPELGMEELREFVKAAEGKCGGILVALSGQEGDYKYVITSSVVDLSTIVKPMNEKLVGKGGGRSAMLQGSFATELSRIKEYFK